MEETIHLTATTKAARYEEFIPQFQAIISDEHDEVSVLANATAALRQGFGWFWIGFYLVREGELHLGPFQGDIACYRIRKGRGVCGTAWAQAQTQVVPDVDQFPGHIACSSLSRSEIVIPLILNDEVHGLLDIDSDQLATFDDTDRHYLEQICAILIQSLYA